LNDGTAGHVDMVISSSATVAPQVESGQLRALIQFGDQRASFIPNTATAVEQGLESLRAYSWFGFFGPAGTPKPVIDRFYKEVVAGMRDEKTHSIFINKFRVDVPLPTPEELRKSIADGLPFWAKIIRDNNIKAGS
jgi:tripartite-type tricarboxylate transporter receptor subunit TctC